MDLLSRPAGRDKYGSRRLAWPLSENRPMNDLWLLGVVGGSAGAALGFPIVAKRERSPGEPWTAEALLGLWLLMIGVGMILIGLRHGVVVTGGANRLAEHVGNVLNLLAWPVLVATA